MPVRKRGGIWYYDFMINRARYRGHIPEAHTRKQAVFVEGQKRQEVFDGRYGKPSGNGGFEEFARQTYLPHSKKHKKASTYYSDTRHVELFCRQFKGMTFREINPLIIERFKQQRSDGFTKRSGPRAQVTVNRELATLSSIFSLAVDYGCCESNPVLKVRKFRTYSRRERVLTEDEEIILMNALQEHYAKLRPAIVLGLYTGMRRGEILNLKWSNVDFEKNEITLQSGTTKSGKARTLPMNDLVTQALLEWREVCDNKEKLFSGRGYTVDNFTRLTCELCEALGLHGVTMHTLRHTFASRLAMKNVNLAIIRDLLGHSTFKMTDRYTHVSTETMHEAVKGLETPANRHRFVTLLSMDRGSDNANSLKTKPEPMSMPDPPIDSSIAML